MTFTFVLPSNNRAVDKMCSIGLICGAEYELACGPCTMHIIQTTTFTHTCAMQRSCRGAQVDLSFWIYSFADLKLPIGSNHSHSHRADTAHIYFHIYRLWRYCHNVRIHQRPRIEVDAINQLPFVVVQLLQQLSSVLTSRRETRGKRQKELTIWMEYRKTHKGKMKKLSHINGCKNVNWNWSIASCVYDTHNKKGIGRLAIKTMDNIHGIWHGICL